MIFKMGIFARGCKHRAKHAVMHAYIKSSQVKVYLWSTFNTTTDIQSAVQLKSKRHNQANTKYTHGYNNKYKIQELNNKVHLNVL